MTAKTLWTCSKLIGLLTPFIFFLNSCSTLNPMLQEDSSLPKLDSVKALADVSSVGFEWKLMQDENVKGFVIYRSKPNEKELQEIERIKNASATHFYDDNLKPQSTYIYGFKILGENDTISQTMQTLEVKTSFIDAVESVFAINNKPRTIKIIYSPHPNPSVDSYLIQRLDKAGEFKTIATIPHRLGVEYFDEDLQDGQTYTYRVIAKNFEGIKSKASASVSATTIPQPAPIENIQASNDLPRTIIITWNEAPDSQGVSKKRYRISYSANGKTYKNLATTNQTQYTHKLKDKENGVSYTYQVVLLGDNGLQGRLSSYPAKGSSLPPPSAPTQFEGTMLDNRATLSWQTPSDDRIVSYVVYRKEKSLWNQSMRFIDIHDTRFIDKEMQEGKAYVYSVVSVDINGIESTPSKEITLQKAKP
ncbi:hypothetical protein [Helicobacter typhlonius]|uniref:hypothetical protein n=1 Tax=Helicobacter typhlonius TaxID=76936 RepID=UPI002FE3AE5C